MQRFYSLPYFYMDYFEKLCVIYIYIYIVVLFGPVKSELGVIPSGQENHSGAEHLNFPSGELNVIFLQSNISLRKNQRPVNLGL